MTGIYVRAKRGDKWVNVEVEYLSEDELKAVFASADKDRVIMFFAAVTEWMCEHIVEDTADGAEHE